MFGTLCAKETWKTAADGCDGRLTAVSRPANLRALASIGRFVAVLSRTAGVDGRMFSLCPAALKHTRFATIASRGEEECRYSGNRFERYREVAIDAETAGRTALPGMAFLYPTPLTCPPCARPARFDRRCFRPGCSEPIHLFPRFQVALSKYSSIAMVRFDFEVFGNPERSRFFGMDFGNEALSKS